MPSGTDLLGDAIRAARMKKGYTQEVFAEKTEETILHTDGLSPQAVDVLVRLIDVMKQETPPCSNV